MISFCSVSVSVWHYLGKTISRNMWLELWVLFLDLNVVNLKKSLVCTGDRFSCDGLVQDCSNSSVLAMELLQSCLCWAIDIAEGIELTCRFFSWFWWAGAISLLWEKVTAALWIRVVVWLVNCKWWLPPFTRSRTAFLDKIRVSMGNGAL